MISHSPTVIHTENVRLHVCAQALDGDAEERLASERLQGVVFVGAMQPNTSIAEMMNDQMSDFHRSSSGALLTILKLLFKQNSSSKLLAVTKGAVATGQESQLMAHQAPLWGLVRGLPHPFLDMSESRIITRLAEYLSLPSHKRL